MEDVALQLVKAAYRKLSREELCLFSQIRGLPIVGSNEDFAYRLASHDLHVYHYTDGHSDISTSAAPSTETPRKVTPDLPVEIISIILEFLGDWEITQALAIPTTLQRPPDWYCASGTDFAMMSGNLALIRAIDLDMNPPSRIGVDIVIRFGYIHVLQHVHSHHRKIYLTRFHDTIPTRASHYGRTTVLSWWKHELEEHPNSLPKIKAASIAEAVDAASRNGQIASLDWWMSCGYPFEFTEAALESASVKNQIAVLDWWKQQHTLNRVSLKIGKVMETATRHNRAQVLDWWDHSGLPIQYRVCDIEEALEDAIGGGDNTRKWWQAKGVDFNANDKEWMKLQNLN
ncbi:hypothetical protein EV361DRAFT_530818 [Lentinula raphanica]|uniref:SAP domain-containing protein n=1 Tax=Lentinula raphanica TaxID=153919 RepID=A0AA38PLV6_9AGAR|nr:hypothetical protein F5880DRAFT_1740140 [Lentinula raphanica]KAJ3845053.1 hypothetical protein F5878DRAFT_414925 [Lentinula raphanica]KAJ3977737.1 hypothetical protein EV361DRAFT_530818 [Lentinula raphanica]